MLGECMTNMPRLTVYAAKGDVDKVRSIRCA